MIGALSTLVSAMIRTSITGSSAFLGALLLNGCAASPENNQAQKGSPQVPQAQFTLTAEKTHSRFSRTIPPVLRVPSGAVVALETPEVTAGQLKETSTAADLKKLNFDPIHPLTGPIFVEGAAPGDVLAVTVHK